MKAAVRGQMWFGAISTPMTSTLLVASWCYQIEELQKVFWVLIILSSSLFQVFSLPEEALSAADALHDSNPYSEFWDQNEPVFAVSTIPLISFVITTLVAVTLRAALPAYWPTAWAMWMALGCVLSMARSFRYLSIFDESGDRWRAYTLVTAGCVILGASSLARDQASTRVVLLGANHVVLVINRMWTMCGMDSVLRAEEDCKSVRSASSSVFSDGSCNKSEV
ncbi:hypothetical protein BHE90_017206 [Fusarium euwallaceae]|uniref:Uncharacterized protein n=4 Tax=Fusarium solani species complex TaxID=232080 RepID=A0A3M2QY23_9HYPO|nr:hypothetical protein CDV36_016186 [Fusarium kuroshium]RSL41731.1 hypothetical protein CEP51_016552 [Fusarium floridanum]RTE68416.1 hypothetical protein BHE90_017206 [Fusarium euwallaceae]